MARFISKKPHHRLVRPTGSRGISRKVPPRPSVQAVVEPEIIETPVEEAVQAVVEPAKEKKKPKKKTQQAEEIIINEEETDMNEKVEKIGTILDGNTPVKIERKEKGLYERTQESVVILNEDNKMLLKD